MDRRAPIRRQRRRRSIAALGVVLLLLAVAVAQLARGVPAARVSVILTRASVVPGRAVSLPWPTDAAAAVTVEGVANLGGVRQNEVRPLASVTKLIAALVILRQHPLRPGQSGPTIRFGPSDEAAYRRDLTENQSVLKVAAGERLTELQALEGMLIPSADNVARVLARWSAGNSRVFVQDMQREAARLGLRHVQLLEPSGLDPADVGTAADMVRVGAAVMANPVLRQIVAMPSVSLPVAGTVDNYDSVLGQDGIVGIKTGSMSAAGGNFVFAAEHRVGGRMVTIIGAVLGAAGRVPLQTALDEARGLVTAAAADIRRVVLIPAGRRVLSVNSAWASPVAGRTRRAATLLAVPGQKLRFRVTLMPKLAAGRIPDLAAGQRIATLAVRYQGQRLQLPVSAATTLSGPSLVYRLTRL